MTQQGRLLFYIFVSLLNHALARKTIFISADGFRWDYFGRYETPGLRKLRMHGVHVKNLENAFATVTFPNHFTLVTGLYEESHGIVDNDMFDPLFNESFHMNTIDPKWWQGGEPIWVTANKSDIGSVCVNWVGCSIPVEGIRPTMWQSYNGSIPYSDRVDTVLDGLFSDKDVDVDLGLLYFEEPDHSCHMHGPDSPEVERAIAAVDQAISMLLERVDLSEVNIIFTADHGGYQVSQEKLIVIDMYLQNLEYFISAEGAVAHVWSTDDDFVDRALFMLSRIPVDRGICRRKQDVPEDLHYSNNRRIAPIVCVAELGWSFVRSAEESKSFTLRGSHGWDARNDPDSPMRPIFIAAGPDIVRSDATFAPFPNVNIYPLVHHLLGIDRSNTPHINGSIEEVRHIIKAPADTLLDPYVVVQW